jgi:probable rRNA maturation factor
LNLSKADLSIVFVDNKEIGELNQHYRHKDSSTNVLSFSMREGEGKEINPNLLGDIVISLETAKKEAAEAGFSLEEIIDFYIIHGLLNLLRHPTYNKEYEVKMRQLWQVLGHKPYWEEKENGKIGG